MPTRPALITPKRIFTAAMGITAALRGIAYIQPASIPDGLSTLANATGGLHVWGWAWIAVGIIALAGAAARRTTAPLIPFAAVNVLWGGSYATEWARQIDWEQTIETARIVSESRDWITSVSYFALAVATLAVIRLVDPAEVTRRGRGGDES